MRRTLPLFALILLLTQCVKDIEIFDEKNFKPEIQVISYLIAGEQPRVFVSKTNILGYLSQNDFLPGAEITLNGPVEYTFSQDIYNYSPILDSIISYIGTPAIQQDAYYTIQVKVNNKKLNGSTYVPPPPPLSQIDLSNLQISAHDTTMEVYTIVNDSIIDTAFTMRDFNISGVINIQFDDDTTTQNYYLIAIGANDIFFYYRYIDSLDIETVELDTSCVGLFFDYQEASSFKDFTYLYTLPYFLKKTYSINPYGIVVSDKSINSKKQNLYLELYYNIFTAIDTLKLRISVLHLSQDVYQLLTSLENYYEADIEYNPFVEPINVYSNIDGGLGIVGGVYVLDTILNLTPNER